MNKLISLLFLTFVLSSCINNSSSVSSSFKGYDDIEGTIVDPGKYEDVKQFIVTGKVETTTKERIKPFNTDMT